MKNIYIAVCLLMAAALSACGSNFEWFPSYTDTSPPNVSAILSNNSSLSNGRTVHVASLPASVTFTSSEAATVYYTTNGNAPTGSPNTISFTAAGSATVSNLITATNTVLKFFGIDTANPGNASAIQSVTISSP